MIQTKERENEGSGKNDHQIQKMDTDFFQNRTIYRIPQIVTRAGTRIEIVIWWRIIVGSVELAQTVPGTVVSRKSKIRSHHIYSHLKEKMLVFVYREQEDIKIHNNYDECKPKMNDNIRKKILDSANESK